MLSIWTGLRFCHLIKSEQTRAQMDELIGSSFFPFFFRDTRNPMLILLLKDLCLKHLLISGKWSGNKDPL